MTEQEIRKLNRRELLALCLRQRQKLDQAAERRHELELENESLMASLARVGKALDQQRVKGEGAAEALAAKSAAYDELARQLAEEQAGKARLEQQVQSIAEKFAQLKPLLREKDEKLRAAERRIADQEGTIRILQARFPTGRD